MAAVQMQDIIVIVAGKLLLVVLGFLEFILANAALLVLWLDVAENELKIGEVTILNDLQYLRILLLFLFL